MTDFSKHLGRLIALLVAVVGTLAFSAPAFAVSGADFTTMNTSFDGTGHCLNGNGNVNCNIYNGKQYVWTNGGPDANKLLPDGYYFFAVLIPSGQQDPNDGTPGNLSDDYDTYQNRKFRVTNGEISSYAGTHLFDKDENDNNEWKIRLYPYADTTNNGGVYIMATCFIGTTGTSYPVEPKSCKYDAFKVPIDDHTPPECPTPHFFTNADGKWTAQATFSDAGGIDTIQVVDFTNAVPEFSSWYQGTTQNIVLTAPKIDNNKPARVVIYVRDVAGNQVTCDPVLTTLKAGSRQLAKRQSFSRLTRHEDTVTIRNGRPGLSRVVIRVNGRRFVARGLRAGERRTVKIGSALRAGNKNRISLSGTGSRGGSATVMVSN